MRTLGRFLVIFTTAILGTLDKLTRKVRNHGVKKGTDQITIVATGTFYSDNWLITHLMPLSQSTKVDKIYFVTGAPIPKIPNVVHVTPPEWLKRIARPSLSRLITFVTFTFRKRPDAVLGFHLLLNGIFAKLLANLTKATSIYVCGGGKREFEGGGFATENRLFRRLGRPSLYVERQLLDFVRGMDLTVVMGSSVAAYLREELQVLGQIMVNPGGFDDAIYYRTTSQKKYDLVIVGRLSEVKQVDQFIDLVASLKREFPKIKAVVVGDGPSRSSLEDYAASLDLDATVRFVGWQKNVAGWLQASRIFFLTSASEGVSQAMLQAMMCGLPAIVPAVGDLADCVESGRNGFLVAPNDGDAYRHAAAQLLSNERLYDEFSVLASDAASRYTYRAASNVWSEYFGPGRDSGRPNV